MPTFCPNWTKAQVVGNQIKVQRCTFAQIRQSGGKTARQHNLEILRNLPIHLPPLALQETFELRCSDVISIQSQQSAATAKAQAAFDALLARCFAPSVAA